MAACTPSGGTPKHRNKFSPHPESPRKFCGQTRTFAVPTLLDRTEPRSAVGNEEKCGVRMPHQTQALAASNRAKLRSML
jgi:hypothetical protein